MDKKFLCKCPRPMHCADDTRHNEPPFITCLKCGKYPKGEAEKE